MASAQAYGERFFTLSQDLLCVMDRPGKLIATNPAWQTMLGWSVDALAGMSYHDLTHPDDLAATEIVHAQGIVGAGVTDHLARCRCQDEAYLWILWAASVDPATGLIFATGRDVTKRQADAMRLARLAAIINNSDDAILSKDLDLKVTTWNHGAEGIYGYTEAEMLGRSISVLIPHDREGEESTILGWGVAGEAIDHFETERLCKDGTTVQVSLSTSVIRDLDGRVIGASSIAHDISASHALAGAQGQVMKRLLLAAEFRDKATGQHIIRMAHLCGQIAAVLGWSPQRVSDIEAAAEMHDVGKIAIPDSILQKPGPLSAEQRTVMQTHAQIGHQMLSGTSIAVIDLAAEIALTHHERYDGTGYPHGLAGEDIPMAGRIAAVADVFDALSTDRIYRPALTLGDALAIMRAGSGTQFDAKILDALFEVLLTERLTSPPSRTISRPPTPRPKTAARRGRRGSTRAMPEHKLSSA